MSDTQQNANKGKNIIVIQNLGDTNKRISISLSYFSKNYFEDPEYSDFTNPNLVLTAKTVQTCLTPFTNVVEDIIDCTNSTQEVSLFLNPNTPFTVELEDTKHSFQNADEFLKSSVLPSNITKELLQTYTKDPITECSVSLDSFKPFMIELNNKQFKFYSIEELYEHEDTLKNFNIVLKVLSK